MNRPGFRALDRFSVVNRIAQHVEHTAEHFLTDRNFDRLAGRDDFHTAARPSLGESMMQRTVSPPTCCATSMT